MKSNTMICGRYAECLLQPGVMNCHFVCKEAAENYREIGETLVRRMISESTISKTATASSALDKNESDNTAPIGDWFHNQRYLGSSSWCLESKMSFLTTHRQSTDELTIYFSLPLSENEVNIIKSDAGIIDFWVAKRDMFPLLHRRALQIFFTPVSSTHSERDFSLIKLLLTPNKNCMKCDIVNATATVRSALLQ